MVNREMAESTNSSGPRRHRRRLALRFLPPVLVLALIAGFLVAGTFHDDNHADATVEEGNVGINCKGPLDLFAYIAPSFACPYADGYYGTFLFDQMNPDGSFGSNEATKLEDTMMSVMAIGGRGQQSYTPPVQWSTSGARFSLTKAVQESIDPGFNPSSGDPLPPVKYLRDATAAACGAPSPDIGLIARLGYTLTSVADDPTDVEGCNTVAMVLDSLNAATGQIGAGIVDTVWGTYLLYAAGTDGIPSLSDPEAARSAIVGYLLGTQTLPGGGWSTDGTTLDPELTARVIMALNALGERGDFVQTSIEAVAAVQNPDGGFGGSEGVSCTEPTALVHGMLIIDTFYNQWGLFKNGKGGYNGLNGTGGRMGIEYPLLWEALTYAHNGPGHVYVQPDYEGRFVTCWQGLDDGGAGGDYDTMTPDELAQVGPTSTAVYYAHFSDPILASGEGPPATVPPVTPATGATAAEANPNVTG